MTYVSKKEKVFDLPEQEESSSMSLKHAETRLMRFPSVNDRRAWTSEECQRYQYLYGLINSSESNANKSASFKYIPFDVLLAILMAEKDAYIQELLDRQDDKSCCGGKLYRAEGFEDSDDDRDALIRKDAEMVALKNKISGLESELEDYRDTLTKAMHKLENMDDIMSENNLLREKLKYSEETIKYLEERKHELEKELHCIKRIKEGESNAEVEQSHSIKKHAWDAGDCEEILRLSSERNILLLQVEQLQKELERAKTNAAEVELLRKISQTTACNLEEISKENEYYKKKLETMRCLEKHIEELKKQAQTLTDKYKKESQKANDHLKQVHLSTKELHMLREERDRLQKRVEELTTHETQYLALQSKLNQVEIILDENEMLNKKLIQLDRLELENEHLKLKIDHLQSAEIKAAEDKERIIKLQCAVVDQEEEIKKMLRQIEELSEGYADKNEIHCLKNELEEKNGKLKQYERQLAEIPVLESEIEELKNKLHKCIEDFKTDKDLLKRLQEELEACQTRCHELEEIAPLCPSPEPIIENDNSEQTLKENVTFEEKGEIDGEFSRKDIEIQSTTKAYNDQSIDVNLIKFDFLSIDRLKELEERNRVLNSEVEILKSKLSEINLDDIVNQTNEMKEHLRAKDDRIIQLENQILFLQTQLQDYDNIDNLKQNLNELEQEIESLKEINQNLEKEAESHHDSMNKIKELESVLKTEQKARICALNLVKETEDKLLEERHQKEAKIRITKLQKEEANVARQELYSNFLSEINFLKASKDLSRKIIKELKKENEILKELKDFSEKVENKALRNLNKKLRAKVKALKSLSKPKLQTDYESLQEKMRMLLKETDTLMNEISDLKLALNSEKKTKDFLEKELIELQAEIADCLKAGSQMINQELANKDVLIEEARNKLLTVEQELEKSLKETQLLRQEKEDLLNNCNKLQSEQYNLKTEVNQLSAQLEEHKNLEIEINRLSEKIEKQNIIEIEFNRLSAEKKIQKSADNNLNILSAQAEESNKQKDELLEFENRVKQLNQVITDQENKEKELMEEIKELQNDLFKYTNLEAELQMENKNLRKELNSKEEETIIIRQSCADLENELQRKNSEIEVLKVKLLETNVTENSDMNCGTDPSEKYDEDALSQIENELDNLRVKLSEYKKMEEEMGTLKMKRDSLLEKTLLFEAEIECLKNQLCDFESIKAELEELKAEKQMAENSEDKYEANDISNLLLELEEQKLEVANLKTENENLQNDLTKAENLLEVSKKLHKTISQIQLMSLSTEFFTPPNLPSPHSSSPMVLEVKKDEMISIITHQKALNDLENQFKMKIQTLRERNSKKIKKLALHYEKDAKCRSKAFHDNINSMKSSYENGIRKLVEKHKASIEKLQQLHEEEVEELNKNYEIQMDALERQNNDLVNEMKIESADKCKQMVEQHNREIKKLEIKYEELLKEKEAEIQAERSKVESAVAHTANEIKEVHEQTVNNLTQFYQSSILELEEKHNKELKKCKKQNVRRIELMTNKYEDLLVEERKKYEQQLEEMLHQLKIGHQGVTPDGISSFVPKRALSSSSRLEFIEILQKILNEGLESLTLDEMILVHSKTCFTPESMIDRNEREEGITEAIGDGCRHKALMTASKEELINKIFALEHEIVIKQLETHEAINMEAAEKCRIQELKGELCRMQQSNSELKRDLTNQSKLYMDTKIEKYMIDRQVLMSETAIMEKEKELENEKAERRRLEEELQTERANLKNLTAMLNAEKERFITQRKRDSDYVESIRLRLEEALKHEHMMESQLDYESRFRAKLESELQSLQKSFDFIIDLPSAPLHIDSKTVEDFNNFDHCETIKEVRNNNRNRHKSVSKPLHNL